MINDEKAKSANESFYEAFNKRDIEAMQQVWGEGGKETCVHPGWPPLIGFDAILNSWAGIFENSGNMDIRISDVRVVASADLAWVSCTEKLFTIAESGVLVSQVCATNLFGVEGDVWKMIMHHASPFPANEETGDVSKN
ncbi:MAG: nuclear transport factor 2 family protein [Nitrospinaceae bacterium]|nr:nuclear transport factor 2 family protein [Nitrospina sp.]MBT5377203.1 nuclear transport factor 2 family protein [Nitrospinaceae bacterium]MBT5867505.1 nuclear transport factor 2 family protein [Nitrospinaceae bacterium]MBT6345922.1 nuclear transport factor 2 family protein [Nitrospina sp.]